MAETIQNINLNLSTKKKFTLDGDPNRVIELDISDINIIDRATTAFRNIEKLQADWESLPIPKNPNNEDDGETLNDTVSTIEDFNTQFAEIENKLKQELNYMFDSDIAGTIFEANSPFSMVNGKFKFQQVVDVLMSLYENQIQSDVKKLNRQKVVNKTQRYIKK